jgi:hypothetical protein
MIDGAGALARARSSVSLVVAAGALLHPAAAWAQALDTGSGDAAVGLFAGIWALVLGMQACCWLGFAVVGIGGLVLWILMLIDAIQRPLTDFPQAADENTRLLWILIILLTGFVGAAVYYFMVKRPPASEGSADPKA